MSEGQIFILIGSSGAIAFILGILAGYAMTRTKKIVEEVHGSATPPKGWAVPVPAEELRLLQELEIVASKYVLHRRTTTGIIGEPGSWFKDKARAEIELFGNLADAVESLKEQEAIERK